MPILIDAYMPMYREAIENSYVRKNVTFPAWLERIAEAKGLNFSHILQRALKERLGAKEGNFRQIRQFEQPEAWVCRWFT